MDNSEQTARIKHLEIQFEQMRSQLAEIKTALKDNLPYELANQQVWVQILGEFTGLPEPEILHRVARAKAEWLKRLTPPKSSS